MPLPYIRPASLDPENLDQIQLMLAPRPVPPPPEVPFTPTQPLMGLQDMLLSLASPGGLGGSPGGPGYRGPSVNLGGPPHQEAIDIARWIEHRPGFEVSGLHGFQGTPQITSGHVTNSQHYGPGYAGDVSYVGGGRFGAEPAALDWLNNALQRRYGDTLTELLWRVADHYDHLHFGTRPGG